ncbi:helix-turn-helix transcriptional regulator [Amycolatopsis rhabdoformis]|uniref:Helix-turn-helix transcriptional regulator n=1 Tax=Amycolatopsis rhabdoformis TaxID=1448059 RepID=A0ABZ1I9M1_9PSEU|nr:helix-turn-helix transcriptional regulator [Amycolatopsis rhabdoformis]WSE31115.1 helix-turn-helix transcriptional regulator [Amycolatopsis rhabdoformis]
MSQPSPALAERLRSLRKQSWAGVVITQRQLAEAFGVSNALLSSWENSSNPTSPPMVRLDAYATFFATRRSVEGQGFKVLSEEQLTDEEHRRREDLLTELTDLRGGTHESTGSAEFAPGNLWRFPPNEDVVIVDSQLPPAMRIEYADPANPDYSRLFSYADPDALIELYGHIRACNPASNVSFRTTNSTSPLRPKDYTAHLVLLGGVDWNPQTRDLLNLIDAPVNQLGRGGPGEDELGGFEVTRADGTTERFDPKFSPDGTLVGDVALFYHGVNPLNRKRTVTVCNGMYGRGTLGAVRALTDPRFRDRNQTHLDTRFAAADSFSIISRVPIFNNQGLTPDWTLAEHRLHEWPETS